MSKELKNIIISSVLLIIGLVVEIFIQTPTIFGIDLISLAIFLIAYLVVGFKIILEVLEEIKELNVFDEDFLMCIASIGAFIIGEWAEGAAIMLLFCVGEYFEDLSKDKTRKAVQSLMDIRPLKANVIKDGKIIEVEPKDVKVGDLVLLKNGEKLAVDGIVVEGDGMLDTAALTGENVPRHVMVGSEVLSGSINVYTALTVRCVKEYQDSVVAKILELVESQTGRKAKTENFIRKFAKIYTPAVCILTLLIAIVPSIITKDLSTWVYRAISFLVVSCPCALVISVPLSYFLGIGGASKYGILIKGANYLELVNQIDYVVFDKTGTLTDGTFKVVDVFPSQSKEEILRLASICELKSNHPIAKSILQANTLEIDRNYTVKEEVGMGIIAENKEQVLAFGNNKLMAKLGVEVPFDKDVIGTVCHLAKNGEYVGTVVIADTIKPEAKKTIDYLKSKNIKCAMLTGDYNRYAKAVAKSLGIEEYQAELLPIDKVNAIEKYSNNGKNKVAFVGDGINDAPVLTRADLGISMGGVGSQIAIECADSVFMYDNLDAIITLKKVAKRTSAVVKTNIFLAIAIKLSVLILCGLGIANMWLAVFADVGLTILAVLNATSCMRVK